MNKYIYTLPGSNSNSNMVHMYKHTCIYYIYNVIYVYMTHTKCINRILCLYLLLRIDDTAYDLASLLWKSICTSFTLHKSGKNNELCMLYVS